MSDKQPAPKDFETLVQLIHERFDGMSNSHQKISIYLTQNPNEIAVHSIRGRHPRTHAGPNTIHPEDDSSEERVNNAYATLRNRSTK